MNPAPSRSATSPTSSRESLAAIYCCVSSLPGKTRNQRYLEKLKLNPEKYRAHLEKNRNGAKRQKEKERSNPNLWQDRIQKQRNRRSNPDYRSRMNAKDMERQRGLPDSTVASILGLKLADCPKELIEMKRAHICLSKALGTKMKSI